MLENSIYSFTSPEGCAAILWKDKDFTDQAASGLRLTVQDLYAEKIVTKHHRTPGRRPNKRYFETQNYFEPRLRPGDPVIARIQCTSAIPSSSDEHGELSGLRLEVLKAVEEPQRIVEGGDGELLAVRELDFGQTHRCRVS